MQKYIFDKSKYGTIIFMILILIGLYWTSIYSYLLFHSVAELFGVIVACGIFMISWNSRHILDNNYFLFIGIAYLIIGSVDLTHTLSYKGMGVFQGSDTNLPTQLWIAARYIESLSLCIAPLFFGRKVKTNFILCSYIFVSFFLFGTIFYWDIFPACFVEGAGLTSFKKSSEYIISAILLASIVMLFRKRSEFDASIFRMLITSIILTILSELAFTFYIHAYGLSNLIGHYLKLISFYLVYKAVIVSGLTKPHAMLFRNLKQSEESLQKARAELEIKVAERTAELSKSNKLLNNEIAEHEAAKEHLQQNKDMLQSIFDGILDPLIVLDKDMVTKIINKAAVEYYGVASIQGAIGRPCYQAFKARSEPCTGCEVPAVISNAQSTAFERKGLSELYKFEKIIIYILKEGNGEPVEFIIRIHDITERKLMEKQIIQSEKMASLGVLVSSVGHEINNPNSFVSFNIPILKDYINEMLPIIDEYAAGHSKFELCNMAYPEFRQDILKLLINIENGSGRISSFVSNLREYSRYKDKNPLVRVELKDIIERILSICHSKIKNSVKSFVKNVPEHLPPIYTEPYTIEQILINFLVNASQAADKENSWIKLNITLNDAVPEHISIEVSDNGCGMDEETQHKIFDPFFTTKSSVEGTGLGLYVCHNLAERLKGRIETESEPGMGSIFKLILPIEKQS